MGDNKVALMSGCLFGGSGGAGAPPGKVALMVARTHKHMVPVRSKLGGTYTL